jgi:hypothetical protein
MLVAAQHRREVLSMRWPKGRSSLPRMARRVVDLHREAIAEGRGARNWYRERSRDVEERFRVALRRATREIREAP